MVKHLGREYLGGLRMVLVMGWEEIPTVTIWQGGEGGGVNAPLPTHSLNETVTCVHVLELRKKRSSLIPRPSFHGVASFPGPPSWSGLIPRPSFHGVASFPGPPFMEWPHSQALFSWSGLIPRPSFHGVASSGVEEAN